MSDLRFLDLVKPFAPFLPEIAAPERKVPFKQKMLWTGVTLLIFLVMSQVPLYGIVSSDSSDPLLWLRMILAANRGTLMELGISPIVTSSMLVQLLVGSQLIEVNMELKSDREMYQLVQKFLAIIIAFGQATAYVLTGMYGRPQDLGAGICLLLILQLAAASLIVLLLDELLQKGYGLGSGISLFIATINCENIFWKAFSPTTYHIANGVQFEGAVINFVYVMFTWDNKAAALYQAFFRSGLTSSQIQLPNLWNFFATLLVFGVVIYLQDFRVEIPIRSQKFRGYRSTFPVKLLYTSNTPIMLQSALTSNLFFASRLLFNRFSSNFLVRFLGVWEQTATSGLSYYLSPPASFQDALIDPIHTLVYVFFTMFACALFSKLWIEVSGASPRDVAKQLKSQQLVMAGHREGSMYKELKRIIPTAAWLSGAVVGALAVASDLLGALGSGTAVLLCTTTIYGYYEQLQKEIKGDQYGLPVTPMMQ
ncbi:Protein transport protein sec61 subunit alpha [Schizosaccharomyces pombe]|uniref:Protein transport protein sec61 subunit alpha n=1 Tax=Schizosaccharomyces pombe (strain 972 / ATCC 24843) TaxID=284812 RepID=SC61A_SCHPO|nr:translocon alpha subunit Sec61 [Schizosaccharomyces pombe]P79088.1 RecName: Full=Protein transport protein sec61 subunit alpha [Schizosaccharomyces pombe 972h-]CAA17802.1 translocon alpha subunit Sec61 [Schizosaccharomyces pombe]CAA72199.1 SEC61 protein [Schizosaccharomyces pombe]CAA72200.1 SEC61 protein [Schizosaccharomyces pombe]|eukprot:NP_595226.1 translocon alpha subunit Sec61 [Schizosaccharomyces pombe]